MDINDVHNPASPPPATRVEQVLRQAPGPAGARREDTVQIPDHARSLTREAAESNGVPDGTLEPERLLDLRRRIQAGEHNSPEMIRAIARGIVARGDV